MNERWQAANPLAVPFDFMSAISAFASYTAGPAQSKVRSVPQAIFPLPLVPNSSIEPVTALSPTHHR
jgi:hypothetical protein